MKDVTDKDHFDIIYDWFSNNVDHIESEYVSIMNSKIGILKTVNIAYNKYKNTMLNFDKIVEKYSTELPTVVYDLLFPQSDILSMVIKWLHDSEHNF